MGGGEDTKRRQGSRALAHQLAAGAFAFFYSSGPSLNEIK